MLTVRKTFYQHWLSKIKWLTVPQRLASEKHQRIKKDLFRTLDKVSCNMLVREKNLNLTDLSDKIAPIYFQSEVDSMLILESQIICHTETNSMQESILTPYTPFTCISIKGVVKMIASPPLDGTLLYITACSQPLILFPFLPLRRLTDTVDRVSAFSPETSIDRY